MHKQTDLMMTSDHKPKTRSIWPMQKSIRNWEIQPPVKS